jgi:hypothetical protein
MILRVVFASFTLMSACGAPGDRRRYFGDGGGSDGGVERTDGSTSDGGTTERDGGECAVEICGNGVDDDCDESVDDGCECIPGEMQSCYTGPLTVRGVGACTDGIQTCDDAVEFGAWGECAGSVVPSAEVCDPEGVDENCDGAVNEGCGCDPSVGPIACGEEEGACAAGVQQCIDGMLGECTGAIGPAAETCNGADDDCDAIVDETLTRTCGSAAGECRRGTETCIDGRWDECSGSREPETEECDNLDNDCDGTVDEELTRECGSSIGACAAGTQTCHAGRWSGCRGETLPAIEECNNVDDDCDEATDEGIARACGTDVGICVAGTERCSAGVFGRCVGSTGPRAEACDGSLDEDCDGTVDDGCACTSGRSMACGVDTGECRRGTQTCSASGMWGPCTGAIDPALERCNGLDDDCDGSIDEGVCSIPVVTCPADVTAEVLSTISLLGGGSDPDGGAVTYRWTVRSRPLGSSSNATPPDAASTTFFLDASGAYSLELCATDDEGQRACCTVDVTSTPPGVLHVELSWDTEYGDVDLHLLNATRAPPDGWWTNDDTYYANDAPDWPPVGIDSNPTLDIDDTDGFGPENITIDRRPAAGTYNIGVHYYCEESIDGTGVGSGRTNATIRVFCGGAIIATYTGIRLDRTDDWVNVARVSYPACAGMSVSTRTEGSALLPATFTSARHCDIACTTDADCPSSEQCVGSSCELP